MPTTTTSNTTVLSESDRKFFLENGYIKIPSCFSRSAASQLTQTTWTRLGISNPEDRTQWDAALAQHPNAHLGRINMPTHNTFPVAEFAPKAWRAIGELLAPLADIDAGFVKIEDLVTEQTSQWNDGWIMNLGLPSSESNSNAERGRPEDLPGWHTDGDFFIHYLDSPEQGLLVIPLYSDIRPGGGGTMLCPGAIKYTATHLFEHPEGVSPFMMPRDENPTFDPIVDEKERGLSWFCDVAKRVAAESEAENGAKNAFIEATGSVGDVYLMHPLMLHSASENPRRDIRIITNPAVSLREPFCFQRGQPDRYSLVELATLRALGSSHAAGGGLGGGLGDWAITRDRGEVVPERVRLQRLARQEERMRLGQSDSSAGAGPGAEKQSSGRDVAVEA